MAGTGRPTSADVAARAGVSRATVSYVLNGSTRHSIPTTTRDRVFAAAAELGYTPHAAARALRQGRSNLVLVVLSDVPLGANLTRLVARVTHGVATLGMSAVTWTHGVGQPLGDVLLHLTPRVAVSFRPLPEDERATFASARIPLLGPFVGGAVDLAAQEETTGALQARRLADAGHRRLAVVSTTEPALEPWARGRREGAALAARSLGLDSPVEVALDPADPWAVGHLVTALRTWSTGPDPVTGVCAYDDVVAALTLHAARTAGLDVPDRLSVVGVDDEPFAAFTDPPLTTVRYDLAGLSDAVVERCRAVVAGQPPVRTPIRPRLRVVERASVAAVRP